MSFMRLQANSGCNPSILPGFSERFFRNSFASYGFAHPPESIFVSTGRPHAPGTETPLARRPRWKSEHVSLRITVACPKRNRANNRPIYGATRMLLANFVIRVDRAASEWHKILEYACERCLDSRQNCRYARERLTRILVLPT